MPPIRVLIVDDHAVVRRGLRHLLGTSADMEVVGEAEDAAGALSAAASLQPDVILLDIRLPGISGLQAAPQLRQSVPEARIIVLTTYDDDQYVAEALGSGAHGYILKSASDETVAQAIRAVHQGERLVTPDLMGKVLERFEALSKSRRPALYERAHRQAPRPGPRQKARRGQPRPGRDRSQSPRADLADGGWPMAICRGRACPCPPPGGHKTRLRPCGPSVPKLGTLILL
ncbi:MAG: response regulator transcription factor [Chloroflexi bacterium]|nr:response regulator transcription factor [Chloroflexota bacterium]